MWLIVWLRGPKSRWFLFIGFVDDHYRVVLSLLSFRYEESDCQRTSILLMVNHFSRPNHPSLTCLQASQHINTSTTRESISDPSSKFIKPISTRSLSTSTVLEHSLSGTISTAQAIIIAVGNPLMAKLADVSVPILPWGSRLFTIAALVAARRSLLSLCFTYLDMWVLLEKVRILLTYGV